MPRPAVEPPGLPQIASALNALGLPAPVSARPLAPPWAHANYRLRFPEGSGVPDLMLRQELYAPLRDSLQVELAALSLVNMREDLPVVRDYRVLPPGLLPGRFALSALLPGEQGLGLLRADPARGPEICRAVGALMARLAAVPHSSFGVTPVTGRFLPRRGTWREEWAAHALGALHLARSGGTDLGPLTDLVATRLIDALPALDSVEHLSLVHGDIHPSNLLFLVDEEGRLHLSGLVDWEAAFAGDPLAEWAVPLELPVETLGHILRGYGVERAAALLGTPEARARLEVYVWTRCLTRVAWCAGALFQGEGGRRRAVALEYARMVHASAREPGSVARHLERALAVAGEGAVVAQVPARQAHLALWRALDATHRQPPLDAAGAMALCAAIAAALLACEAPPPWEQRWLAASDEAADRLGPQSGRDWLEVIPDRAAWAQALTAALCERPARSCFALALWWLGLEALTRLAGGPRQDWPVSDAPLRGLETLVRLRLAADADVIGAREQLVHALIGATALQRLGALGLPPPPEARARWSAALRHAWEDLVLFGPGAAKPAAPEEPLGASWLTRSSRPWGSDLLIPTLRLALDRARGLPASPEILWATLGLDGQDGQDLQPSR